MGIRTKLAIGSAILGGFLAHTTAEAVAVLTNQDTVAANTFTNGTVELTINPTTALVAFASMVPGDVVTSPITVTNSVGSAALRYSVTSTATNTDAKGLKDQLVLTVKTVDIDGVTCGSWDGTQLYTGDLDSGTGGKIIGDVAAGQNGVAGTGGDRSLAVSGAEVLCFRVSLPIGTSNAFASATTTATLTFDAEQTANN